MTGFGAQARDERRCRTTDGNSIEHVRQHVKVSITEADLWLHAGDEAVNATAPGDPDFASRDACTLFGLDDDFNPRFLWSRLAQPLTRLQNVWWGKGGCGSPG